MSVTKDDLTGAALGLLDQSNGLSKLTVDALASTLSMSKSTLYKHFDGMEELIYASVERLCEATDTELTEIDTSGSSGDALDAVSGVYGRYADRLPAGLMLSGSRERLPAAARMRLENTENRLGDRVFRAAFGMGAPAHIAHGIKSAYDGMLRFLRTVPSGERSEYVAQLTATLRKGLVS